MKINTLKRQQHKALLLKFDTEFQSNSVSKIIFSFFDENDYLQNNISENIQYEIVLNNGKSIFGIIKKLPENNKYEFLINILGTLIDDYSFDKNLNQYLYVPVLSKFSDEFITSQDILNNDKLLASNNNGGLISKEDWIKINSNLFQTLFQPTDEINLSQKLNILSFESKENEDVSFLLKFVNIDLNFQILLEKTKNQFTIGKINVKNNKKQLVNVKNLQLSLELLKNGNQYLLKIQQLPSNLRKNYFFTLSSTRGKNSQNLILLGDSEVSTRFTPSENIQFYTQNSVQTNQIIFDISNENKQYYDTEKSLFLKYGTYVFDVNKIIDLNSFWCYENESYNYVLDDKSIIYDKNNLLSFPRILSPNDEIFELFVSDNKQVLKIIDRNNLIEKEIWQRFMGEYDNNNSFSEWFQQYPINAKNVQQTVDYNFIDKRTKDLIQKSIENTPSDYVHPDLTINKLRVNSGNVGSVMLSTGESLPIPNLKTQIISIPKNSLGGGIKKYKLTITEEMQQQFGNLINVVVFEKSREE